VPRCRHIVLVERAAAEALGDFPGMGVPLKGKLHWGGRQIKPGGGRNRVRRRTGRAHDCEYEDDYEHEQEHEQEGRGRRRRVLAGADTDFDPDFDSQSSHRVPRPRFSVVF
jgi:hypothetical protein